MIESPAVPVIVNNLASATMLKILDLALMFLRSFPSRERSEVSTLSGFRVLLDRIDPILPAF